jgi:hypothetical protein
MKVVKKNVHTLCTYNTLYHILKNLLKTETGFWNTAIKLIPGSFTFAVNPYILLVNSVTSIVNFFDTGQPVTSYLFFDAGHSVVFVYVARSSVCRQHFFLLCISKG